MNERDKVKALKLFGERVQALCQQKSITLPELANMLDTDHAWIWRVVNGQVDFRYSTVIRIAAALEVDPGDLTTQHK